MRTASQLLDEAGWRLQDGVRKNEKGETLDIEFLIEDPVTERILGPYARQAQRAGDQDLRFAASIRPKSKSGCGATISMW